MNSQINEATQFLKSEHRLILSGTPMENSLQELWSLVNFVEPGLLGTLEFFEKEFCHAIVRGGFTDADKVEQETA